MRFFDVRSIGLILFLGVGSGCATTTHRVDPYPSDAQLERSANAYHAKNGTINPATESDAALSAGLVTLGSLMGSKHKSGDIPLNNKAIHIECTIINDPLQIPCSSVYMILKTEDGEIFSRGRTDANGELLFFVNNDQNYQLEIKAKGYSVTLTPAGPLKAGTNVQIRLQPIHGH
jgi:hypothetical protein